MARVPAEKNREMDPVMINSFRSFIQNPVKVSMLFLALALLGFLSLKKLPLNLFPDVQTPRITISVEAKSMAPEETERRLTRDFERQLASIRGVRNITSFSREGSIVFLVDFHWNRDMEFAYLDVKKNVGVFETNEDVEKIEVFRFDPNAAPLLTLAFIPGTGGEVNRVTVTSLVENSLKPKLETIDGVAHVRPAGESFHEVKVLVNEDLMARYNLTADKVIEEIGNQNIATAGGVILEGNQQMNLKFISRFGTVQEIGRCVVSMAGDHPIHLEDIGRIAVSESRDEVLVFQDGIKTVSLDVFKEPDANAVLTSRRVRKAVQDLNRRGNFGIKIAVDRSLEVEAAIGEVVHSALIGMLLAMLVLFIFLRNVPATLVAAAAIPISIIATFSLMYFQGLSLNLMTLGGLALGAGMLVDNAIVVVENIFRHRRSDLSSSDAAEKGVREVAMAITAATLTTIVVFVPLIYVHGIAGILFRDQALTVVYSLLVSLLVALILIPMLSARIRPARASRPGALNRSYGKFLSLSMKLRWLLFLLFLALMSWTALAIRKIPSRFFPESVGGRISMLLEMPLGSSLEQTGEAANRLQQPLLSLRWRDPALAPLLEAFEGLRISGDIREFLKNASAALDRIEKTHPDHPALKEIPPLLFPEQWSGRLQDVVFSDQAKKDRENYIERVSDLLSPLVVLESVTTTVGTPEGALQSTGENILGPHTARMEIVINPALLRQLEAADVIAMLRDRAGGIPGLKCSFESRNEFLQELLGKNRGDIVVEVHAEELDDLRLSSERVEGAMRAVPELTNVRSNLVLGDENYILQPDRDAMMRGGFKAKDLSSQVEAYLKGDRSDKVKLARGEMGIVVKNPRSEKEGLEGLLNLQIVSASGIKDKLRHLVKLKRERGIREVMRTDQERTLLVMADLEGAGYQDAMESVRTGLDSLAWRSGAYWKPSGEEVQRRESFARLFFALVIAVILVYMVIASILESLVHPLTIMLSVPLSMAGVAAAFLLLDISLNLMGYIGIVMLTGIVVNDAIVLLDRIRQIREGGEGRQVSVVEAVVLAGRQRLRPIVMTSLTTILALFPLALGFGSGAELRRPLAIAVIGGLTSSTLLTLWILPGLYLCVEDLLAFFRRITGIGRKRERQRHS